MIDRKRTLVTFIIMYIKLLNISHRNNKQMTTIHKVKKK